MRLFQNSALYPAYMPRLRRLTEGCDSFSARIDAFLGDRFGAPHFLLPVLSRHPDAFFTNGDDDATQRLWAKEQCMPGTPTLESILLAQIEAHRTEVFYNLDSVRYTSDFVRKLPGCVKKAVTWRAAPSRGSDFGAYDRIVCNFPSILDSYRKAGWNAAYFAPAHDPLMDAYAVNTDRPIDVLFVGGYTRHHRRRAELLEAVAGLGDTHSVVMHLDRSRATRWAESAVGRMLPLGVHRRPDAIRQLSRPPIFGLDLYAALSRSKVVVNGAIDMAGADRGNMRCFEAMGSGCALVSDDGHYPDGMIDQQTMLTYEDTAAAIAAIQTALADPTRAQLLTDNALRMIRATYSKAQQWLAFQGLLA